MKDEAKRKLVQNWLVKAQRDLNSAKKLSGQPDQFLDTAIYHCQQTAEKAIKGFLVFHDQRFEKTHDLEILINLSRLSQKNFLPGMMPASVSLLIPQHSVTRAIF